MKVNNGALSELLSALWEGCHCKRKTYKNLQTFDTFSENIHHLLIFNNTFTSPRLSKKRIKLCFLLRLVD